MSGRGILGRPACHAAPKPLATHDVLLLDSDGYVADHLDFREPFDVVRHKRQLAQGDEVDGDFLWDSDAWLLSCPYVYHL